LRDYLADAGLTLADPKIEEEERQKRLTDYAEALSKIWVHPQLCSAGLVLMAWAGRRGALGAVLCQL
jgi:hypothetical protein